MKAWDAHAHWSWITVRYWIRNSTKKFTIIIQDFILNTNTLNEKPISWRMKKKLSNEIWGQWQIYCLIRSFFFINWISWKFAFLFSLLLFVYCILSYIKECNVNRTCILNVSQLQIEWVSEHAINTRHFSHNKYTWCLIHFDLGVNVIDFQFDHKFVVYF